MVHPDLKIFSGATELGKDFITMVPNESMVKDSQVTITRVRTRIPKTLQREPVISILVSEYGLRVTITAALLGVNGKEDGWFDLHLQGNQNQLDRGIHYLTSLNIEVWLEGESEGIV